MSRADEPWTPRAVRGSVVRAAALCGALLVASFLWTSHLRVLVGPVGAWVVALTFAERWATRDGRLEREQAALFAACAWALTLALFLACDIGLGEAWGDMLGQEAGRSWDLLALRAHSLSRADVITWGVCAVSVATLLGSVVGTWTSRDALGVSTLANAVAGVLLTFLWVGTRVLEGAPPIYGDDAVGVFVAAVFLWVPLSLGSTLGLAIYVALDRLEARVFPGRGTRWGPRGVRRFAARDRLDMRLKRRRIRARIARLRQRRRASDSVETRAWRAPAARGIMRP
ncbi:MAG: hypothetical protein R3F62_12155 [Planctomycetota bacterium]